MQSSEVFNFSGMKKNLDEMGCEHDHCGGCSHGGAGGHLEFALPVKRRLHALRMNQKKRMDIFKAFRAEILALERKYDTLYAPVDQERALIVRGVREPTAEELAGFEDSGIEEVDAAQNDDDLKGIPCFWLTALGMHPNLAEAVEDADHDLLCSLVDIRSTHLPNRPGFRLEFEFAPNDYFENKVLTKEYYLDEPEEDTPAHLAGDDYVFDYAVGTDIKWKEGKNLCFRTVVRTQRHRTKNTTRTVKRQEPVSSFFHFFYPPSVPSDENAVEEEELEDLEARIQIDYEMGEVIKDQIIPDAVSWFTGVALSFADLEDDDEFDGEFDEEDDYDDDDEDDDEEEDSDDEDEEDDEEEEEDSDEDDHYNHRKGQRIANSADAKPECKTQ